jgi:hypothetical protein
MSKYWKFWLSISTTGAVILFTMGALSMMEKDHYWAAALFLFFAFWLPLQSGAREDKPNNLSRQNPNYDDAPDDSVSKDPMGNLDSE